MSRYTVRNISILLAICSLLVGSAHSVCSGGRRNEIGKKAFLCYWGTWSFYRSEEGNTENTDAKFDVDNIDPFLCTHLIYSFAGLNNQTKQIGSLDPYLDYKQGDYEVMEDGQTLYGFHATIERTVQLREKNPDLKVLIAIGGWGQLSKRFSDMAVDPALRQTFIDSVEDFLIKHNLDGLDFDWEYPAYPHEINPGHPDDIINFPILLQELRDRFDAMEANNNRDYWLTAALGAGRSTIDAAYNVSEISKYLDCMNIMAYDFKVYVENSAEFIGHHSPLFSKDNEDEGNKTLTASAAVEYFIEKGAPPEKIALGVGAYGKTYNITGIAGVPKFYDRASGAGKSFGFTQENGSVAYNEICYYLIQHNEMPGWNFNFDYDYYVPFAYNSSLWIGYDNEMSTIGKVDYAERLGLGGMMIWSIEQDDFRNWCQSWYPNAIGGTIKNRMEYHRKK